MIKNLYEVRGKYESISNMLSALSGVAKALPGVKSREIIGVVGELVEELIEVRADEKRLVREAEEAEAKRSSLIKPEDVHKYKNLGNRGFAGCQGQQGCQGSPGATGPTGPAGEGGLIILSSSFGEEEEKQTEDSEASEVAEADPSKAEESHQET